jgi:hypothetical protein
MTNPNVCPTCGSSNVSKDRPEAFEGQIIQSADCMDCLSDWDLVFEFSDVINVAVSK